MSFYDKDLSVVSHCWRWCWRSKLFTISSSSPEQPGRFKPYLEQRISGQRKFKFVRIKGHIHCKKKYNKDILNFFGISKKFI